jgi:uncharacterized repeat protein (TIGR03847 family)
MGRSFELDAPDHFTAGAVGPPGARVFYLQARQAGALLTLRCEKEQVRALGEYLARLLARLPGAPEAAPADPALLEPVEPAWIVAALGAGNDPEQDRILLEARELLEEETGEAPATARFWISRAQAAALVDTVRALVKAGRPLCPVCHQPEDPGGHVCPRSNGRMVPPPAAG